MFYSAEMLRILFLLILSVFVGRRAFAQDGGGVMARTLDPGMPGPAMSVMACLRRGEHRADALTTIDAAFLPPAAFGIGLLRP